MFLVVSLTHGYRLVSPLSELVCGSQLNSGYDHVIQLVYNRSNKTENATYPGCSVKWNSFIFNPRERETRPVGNPDYDRNTHVAADCFVPGNFISLFTSVKSVAMHSVLSMI